MALLPRPIIQSHPEEIGLHAAAHIFRKMQEPKISKLKGGYSSSAGLVFQSWLKDIHEVEFYMGMVAAEDQSFEGLIDHLHNAFKSGKTLSEPISDFYGQSQNTRETEDTFTDDLQVLARNIIVHNPSFYKEHNQQIKVQYAHKLWDQYYAAMAHSALQSFPEEESFTKFWGHLVTMFSGHARQSQSSAASASIDTEVNQIRDLEGKLSKNSGQCQNKINWQEVQITSLQNQNKQLQGLLDSKQLVNVISQAVTTGLKLCSQPPNKGGANSNGTGFVSKPYLGKSRPSQLTPGAHGSLDLDFGCQYCKIIGHLKENCIKLNCWLVMEQRSGQKVSPNTCTLNFNSKLAN